MTQQKLRFDCTLDLQDPKQEYLQACSLFGQTLFPFAGQIELLLGAGAALLETQSLILSQVKNLQLVTLSLLSRQELRIEALEGAANAFHMTVARQRGSARSAACTAELAAFDPIPLSPPQGKLDNLSSITTGEIYEALQDLGLDVNQDFRSIKSAQVHDDGISVVLEIPESIDGSEYICHPTLLEGCFQASAYFINRTNTNQTHYELESIDRAVVHCSLTDTIIAHINVSRNGKHGCPTFDMSIMDFSSGAPLAHFSGMQFRARSASEQRLRLIDGQWLNDLFYEVLWTEERMLADRASCPAQHRNASDKKHPNWVVLSDCQGVASELCARLEASGASVLRIGRRNADTKADDFDIFLEKIDQQSFEKSLASLDLTELNGVVYLWSLDCEISESAIEKSTTEVCLSVMTLLQTLVRQNLPASTKSWLISRGAHLIAGDTEMNYLHSPLIGLSNCVMLEHPELNLRTVDLDPRYSVSQSAAYLFDELQLDDDEDQVALRKQSRMIPRLIDRAPSGHKLPLEGRSFTLVTESEKPCANVVPNMHSLKLQSDEVAVEIWSNSLSQADMDKLLQRQADIPLGFDFAGVVKGAGEKCGVLLGQTVVGLGWGAMSDTVATKSQFVTPIPANLTIDESASIVVPFVTAYAALHRTLENVKPATILVTTDQDGIGLVAAQIARTAGCAVYAAASDSAEKINISRVTDAKILDINDPSFAAAVMASTDQLGVGVVFNTCGGALSELSLSVIKDDGVYIEVGRADSSTDDAVRLAYPDVKYELFDLKQLCEKDPGLIQSTLIALTNWCNTSRFLPVALRKFSLAELADAIECFNSDIAGSRTLLSSPGTDGNIQLHPHRAYIVTGGLGGIGRAVCNWLVDLGARHLEVIGRSKPTTEAESCVNAWKAIGATVNVHSIDVGNGEAMEALLDSVRGEGWPIAGVFHAAGVVADAVFVNQSGQQFETIFRSKVSGTWLLHKLTLQDNLDHFVLFSSGSSLFGSVGQANYAAANSFMDGLAQHRHLRGLPSLSINWGPWSNVGMAAQVAKRGIQHQGAALTTYEGLKALGSLMANYPNPGICVARLNEVAFTDRRDNRPFLRAVKIESKDKVESLSESVKTLRYLLRDVSGKFVPPKLHELLSQYVEEQVKEALKLSPRETIHPQRDLFELGMDSFIAVNMCDRFRDELGIDNVVTAGSLYKHNTIDSLTKYMLSQVQLATERKQEQREAKALLK